MGVNLHKTSNIIFFAVFFPVISFFVAKGVNELFPNLPFWMETISPVFAYGVFYSIFEKYIWHWKIFYFFKIVSTPDLRGRWKGLQISSFKENGKNFEVISVLEVSQTFSKIVTRAYYNKSQSESIVANFVEVNETNYLFYTYDNEPNSLKRGTMERHRGTVKLKYLPNENKLLGTYFNSIGNYGEITFEFESQDLLSRFDK